MLLFNYFASKRTELPPIQSQSSMKNLHSVFAIFFCFCFAATLSSQSARAYEKAGDKAFAGKDYYAAFVHFRDAMSQHPDEVRLWFKYAEVTRQFNAYEEAETYYTKVWRSKEVADFMLSGFWLGQIKKNLGEYQEAIEMFREFLALNPQDSYYANWARNEIETCEWAKNLEAPKDKIIRIDHLDKKINSPYSEFGAFEYGKTLYYSSFRFDFKSDNHLPERRLTKILTSENLEKGRVLPREFNENNKHTAHTALSLNGERIYFTICQYVTSSDIRCEIYYRDRDKRGRWEKKPVRLPDAINKKGFTATQPSVGFDSVAQKEVLFFSSDRPGGKGKLDIWYCELEQGKFLEPKNLEIVNTPEDDISPFFSTATQTLYFSSTGHPGLGGYDIFKINRTQDWGASQNLGKPINSSYHDLYYAPDTKGNHAFFSSNRPGSFYLDPSNKACCYDIYRVEFIDLPENPADEPDISIGQPEQTEPEKPDEPTTLEDFLPLALYFDNDEPDKRTSRITTKKTYETTYFKYIDRKKEFIERFTRTLQADDADEAALAIEEFFENEVKKGYDHLMLFSEILRKQLENGERVEIVIKGYTSPRAKSDYNDRLAQRRISSLRNHFLSYRDGIFESYLTHGKLVISEAPFGETTASPGISDKLEDERNSIYNVEASRERRVEIVEVK